ncbi:hypothetical protein T484DRAFT_1814534 [Baffinella frigidus]|nr:hypothetical protein T484DRAFT_1814534 [Cryptophyta sp. CCMP2293]
MPEFPPSHLDKSSAGYVGLENLGATPSQLEKSSAGYVGLKNLGATCYMNSLHQQLFHVGLKNLGATCYMNSLHQQLFHVPEFRGSILQVPVAQADVSESLMYQMQTVFAHLQEGHKQFYDPWDFCQAYIDYEGHPVNVRQQ